MVEVHGFCDERFRPLKVAFAKNFDDGLEVGASLAVTHRGKFVVDLWAGHADFARTRPWEKDTIVAVYSTTKIATILCFLMVVDRGLVELDQPVAKYWPEFAAGGKSHVTVRQALTHRAGVPGFDPAIPFMTLFDWEAAVSNIATEKHWFGGTAKVCYHPHTYGFLLGEIMRRTDGRRPAQFFREEIAERAGVDFRIESHFKPYLSRLAEEGSLKPPGAYVTAGPLYSRVFGSVGPAPDRRTYQDLTLESPAGSGIGNARSIARFCAIAANGGTLDAIKYLSKEMIDEASKEQVCEIDEYLGGISLGLGFGLDSQWFRAPTPSSFHWGGWGGSWGVMDQKTCVSAGYAMNNLVVPDAFSEGDKRRDRLFDALHAVMAEL